MAGFQDFVKRFTFAYPPKNYIRLYGGKLTVSKDGKDGPDGFEGSYFMLDEAPVTKFLAYNALEVKPFWINIEFPVPRICNSYAFTSANDAPGRNPKSWNVQGSQDMLNWEPLQEMSNQSFPETFLQKVYRFPNTKAYKHYRINITANNGSGNELQIADYVLGFK
ncbi:hypothetical protein D3C85_1385670 [compost metagenome]